MVLSRRMSEYLKKLGIQFHINFEVACLIGRNLKLLLTLGSWVLALNDEAPSIAASLMY